MATNIPAGKPTGMPSASPMLKSSGKPEQQQFGIKTQAKPFAPSANVSTGRPTKQLISGKVNPRISTGRPTQIPAPPKFIDNSNNFGGLDAHANLPGVPSLESVGSSGQLGAEESARFQKQLTAKPPTFGSTEWLQNKVSQLLPAPGYSFLGKIPSLGKFNAVANRRAQEIGIGLKGRRAVDYQKGKEHIHKLMREAGIEPNQLKKKRKNRLDPDAKEQLHDQDTLAQMYALKQILGSRSGQKLQAVHGTRGINTK